MLASAALSSPGFLADSVEDEFELSTVCHRPEGLEQLQEQTKFTRKELQVLYRGFKNVSTPRPALLVSPRCNVQLGGCFAPSGAWGFWDLGVEVSIRLRPDSTSRELSGVA